MKAASAEEAESIVKDGDYGDNGVFSHDGCLDDVEVDYVEDNF